MYLKKIIILLLSCYVVLFGYAYEQNQSSHHALWKLSEISKSQLLEKPNPTRDEVIQEHLFTEILLNKQDLVIQKIVF